MFIKDKTALVFPGQGSQKIGMGAEFMHDQVTKEIFEEANDVLKFDISGMMVDGNSEDLSSTENAQPALLISSYAAFSYLSKMSNLDVTQLAKYVAGHSLGEYSALCMSGVISFEDALRLVRARGEAMKNAVAKGEGAMAAMLGLTYTDVDSIARNAGCWVANDNCEGQVVMSGGEHEIDEASNLAVMQDAKKVMRLDVSVPAHCPMMEPARLELDKELEKITMKSPKVELVMNVTAEVESDVNKIRENLSQQMISTVRWRESMKFLADQGIENIYELGSGKVLTGLAKRCDERLKAVSLSSPRDIDGLLENLNISKSA